MRMSRSLLRCALVSTALLGTATLPASEKVTLLVAARIHTLEADAVPADAMAWDARGRLLAVGKAADLHRRFPTARRIDAAGATVLPGLIDAHGHLMGLGQALSRADLVGAASRSEVVARLRAFAATLPADAWLLGRGWDQNRWPEAGFPSAADLDAAFPDRPVWLRRIDGHAGWANSAALRRVDRELSGDWQPDGGRILREDGRPTGVFVDAAMDLVERAIPAPDDALREQALRRALAMAVSQGLTGVHDMGVSLDDLAVMKRLADRGELPLRITAYADGDAAALTALCVFGPWRHASQRLRMAGVKLYADGALGSRGAALLADYADEPGHRGLLVTEPGALEAAMRKAFDCDLQVATHAIGDRGNRLTLDLYHKLLGTGGGARRWRVEHVQVLALDDIPRFAQLGVLASMQPTHATSDMPWAPARLGPQRLAGAYAWRRLRDAAALLPLGSDFPVEAVDPRLGLYAAVSRQDLAGQPPGGWLPEQRLRIDEAVAGFTQVAAFAGFAEDQVGSLRAGKQADFVLFAGDPFALSAAELPTLRLLSTWVDGEAVFEARTPERTEDRPSP